MADAQLPETIIALVGDHGAATLMPVTVANWFNTSRATIYVRIIDQYGKARWHANRNVPNYMPTETAFRRRHGIVWKCIAKHYLWSIYAGTNSDGVCARFLLSKARMHGETNTDGFRYQWNVGDYVDERYNGHWIHDIDIAVLSHSPKLRATACDHLVSAAIIGDAVAEEDVKYDDDAGDDSGDEYIFCMPLERKK